VSLVPLVVVALWVVVALRVLSIFVGFVTFVVNP